MAFFLYLVSNTTPNTTVNKALSGTCKSPTMLKPFGETIDVEFLTCAWNPAHMVGNRGYHPRV
jgi:hypothetical protein